MMIFMFFYCLILTIMNLTYFNQDKVKKDYPFECGVNFNKSSRKPFSIPFFLITLVFLLFDMEVILLIPLIYSETWLLLSLNIYLFILVWGLIIEYKMKSFEWKN